VFDVLESLFVHSRGSAIGLAAFVGIDQNILPIPLPLRLLPAGTNQFPGGSYIR
jgi:hypothetical protein